MDDQCCDTIICVSASANEDLTINIKETGQDFYADEEDDPNDVIDSNEDIGIDGDDDDEEISDNGDLNYSLNENFINMDSFQNYDSQLIYSTKKISLSDLDEKRIKQMATTTNNPETTLFDEQLNINLKSDNKILGNENEYYLEDKEYGKFLFN